MTVKVPAGVPLFDPIFGNPPPEHPPIYPTEINSNANTLIGIRRRVALRPNFAAHVSVSASISNSANVTSHKCRVELFGFDGGAMNCASPRAVVVTVIVVGLPAVTDAGLNETLAPLGNPLAVNVTVPGKAPPTVAVAIVKFAGWPAVTVCEVVVALTLKSVIVNVSEFDAPPPGVGFTTVTAAVPELAMSAAVIAAVNEVALTNVVVRGLPFHCAVEPFTKLVPVSCSVNAAPPAPVNVGEIEVRVGTGLLAALILKFTAFDMPPPGAGFVTVIAGVPAVATSVAKIAAVNCVALMNVVTRALPAKFTTDVFTKFVPVTVNVNAAEPAVTPVGESEVIVGTGFDPAVTLKFIELEVPPPGAGFVTVIAGVPAVATSAAKIAAVNCAALTNVVTRALPPKFTTEFEIKFVPFTVKVSAPLPAVAPLGESEVIVGAGFVPPVTLRFTEFDVPPPGTGFVTVICAVPIVVTSAARIDAVNCVALTNVVTLGVLLKFTTDVFTKFEPFTVNVNAPEPATTEDGCKEAIAGTGLKP